MKRLLGDLFSIKCKNISKIQREYLRNGAEGDMMKGEAIIFKKHLCESMEYSDGIYEFRHDSIVLTVASDSGVLLKYAYYYLLANKDLWQRYYVGTSSMINLSQYDLERIVIDCPSLSIQERIVGCLDGVLRAKEERTKVQKVLPDFLLAYYQSLKNSYGRYWSEEVKLGDFVKSIGKAKKVKDLPGSVPVVPTPTGIEVCGDKKYTFTVDDTTCNPYFLSVALNASDLLHSLFQDKLLGGHQDWLVAAISDIKLRLPEKEVQKDFEVHYKLLESLMEIMEKSAKKLNRLFEILLYSLLLREQDFNPLRINFLSDNPLITSKEKYTYDDVQGISSLKQYDDKRASLYDYLEKGIIKQLFDTKDGKIKFVGADTTHV